jgi:ribonucleotide monophosphatase NagD (HAD superfamily)
MGRGQAFSRFWFAIGQLGPLSTSTADVLAELRAKKKNVVFVTNASSKSRDDMVSALQQKGIAASKVMPMFDEFRLEAQNDVVPTTYAAAQYLSEHGFNRVFAIGVSPTSSIVSSLSGSPGMMKELAEHGISG